MFPFDSVTLHCYGTYKIPLCHSDGALFDKFHIRSRNESGNDIGALGKHSSGLQDLFENHVKVNLGGGGGGQLDDAASHEGWS